INDVTVLEGDGGVTDAVFTVRLSAARPAPVSVVCRTRDGSATAPSDYTAIPSTTLTFAPGEVTRTISVAVNGDTLVEPDETFFVELSAPLNATIGRGQGTGTIRNDDVGVSPPALSIDDVTVVEGDIGTTSASLTVRLSAPSDQTVSVVYQTQNGTAVAGSDYAPVGATTLTFAPGVIVQTIAVSILGDNVFEPDETVIVTLSAPVNATIARGQATVTIQNDDPRRVYLPLITKPAPPPPPSSGWMTLVSEDFEGNFPGDWQVSDKQPGWGEYTWSRRNCLAVSGAHSGWAVGGGADGSRLPCGSYYPNNARSWMVYGPFSLADATAADLRLKLWLNSEMYVDDLCMMASVDGRNFAGSWTTGVTGGWVDETLDLTDVYQLGNLTGRSQVWIAVIFRSNATITRPIGAYVDDIMLRKYVPSAGSAMPPSEAVTAPPASATLVTRPAQMVYPHAVDRP
ncbi:MAG: hypothetical protein NZ699_05250, partial [Roseiflexus sp.]|nr:hypothetical protein [Roseiflexus sp.]